MQPGAVAIIITTYNHAHFLEAALRSALAQTLPASEIIVVDDGSADHPEHVTSRFPGIRLISQANMGLASARNTGWMAATSEFIVFLDADDRLLSEALRINLQRLINEPAAAFSYGAYVNVDAETCESHVAEFRPARGGYVEFLQENLIGMHATVMYRRAHLEQLGGFEPGLRACEDYDLYLRMAMHWPPLYGPEPLAEYWRHAGNMSRNSAMMLRRSLFVLRQQKAEARRRSALRDYHAGVRAWKQYYVGVWCTEAFRSAGVGRSEISLFRQGLSLTLLAPVTTLRIAMHRMRRELRGRVRAREGR